MTNGDFYPIKRKQGIRNTQKDCYMLQVWSGHLSNHKLYNP